jgi:hypothetical protein
VIFYLVLVQGTGSSGECCVWFPGRILDHSGSIRVNVTGRIRGQARENGVHVPDILNGN